MGTSTSSIIPRLPHLEWFNDIHLFKGNKHFYLSKDGENEMLLYKINMFLWVILKFYRFFVG